MQAAAPQSQSPSDVRVSEDAVAFLEKLAPAMGRHVLGEVDIFPNWTPPPLPRVDADTLKHLTDLKIPSLDGYPSLLLHDLGKLGNGNEQLERRLKCVFRPNHHTSLVNTSGSGKTRLLFEGLCWNWGFYFTSVVDSKLGSRSLGSRDLMHGIDTRLHPSRGFQPKLSNGRHAGRKALNKNRAIAKRVFREILLARLLVFWLFLGISWTAVQSSRPGLTYEGLAAYRRRWLLLQLRPSSLREGPEDIFVQLSYILSDASDEAIENWTKTFMEAVHGHCANLAGRFSPTNEDGPISSPHPPPTLFCILDEAQYAASQHLTSFKSDRGDVYRPVLREIVKAWEVVSRPGDISLIISGTGISKEVVDETMASALLKCSPYHWYHDTGAFDAPGDQQKFLEKYLPTTFLKSESGKRLIQRLWYWLRGRLNLCSNLHRFTTSYLSYLLSNGLRCPHRLLNAYIRQLTKGFDANDAPSFVKEEGADPLPELTYEQFNFSKLHQKPDMLSAIRRLSTDHYMRSHLSTPLGQDEELYVEYGFARFVSGSQGSTVAIDEPLVLLAFRHWTETQRLTTYQHITQRIDLDNCPGNGNAFEEYLALCIDQVFSDKPRLEDVFYFAEPRPDWSHFTAELISLHRTDHDFVELSQARHSASSASSVSLGIDSKSDPPAKTLEWLGHGLNVPICFPHKRMGPDLIFVLRLVEDDSLIWVALQAKFRSTSSLGKDDLEDAVRTVTPACFFRNKDGSTFSGIQLDDIDDVFFKLSSLKDRQKSAGPYSVLRVIASFPAATNLDRGLSNDPDTQGHPIASLNMALVEGVTRHLVPTCFLKNLQARTIQKRKRSNSSLTTDTSKRPKIIR